MAELEKVAGYATIGLGLSQALTPRTAGKLFGLGELDGHAAWLTRMLGVAHVAVGSLALAPETRYATRTATRGLLAADAAVTVAAASSGSLPKRTAAMVLAFVAAVAAADLSVD